MSDTTWAKKFDRDRSNYDRRLSMPEITNLNIPVKKRQKDAVTRLKKILRGALVERFSKKTGATRTLSNPVGYLTEPQPGDPGNIALDFVRSNLELLGLETGDLDEFEIIDTVHSTITGSTQIYLRQTFRGVPVYNGQLQINVNRDGRIISVNNAFIPSIADSTGSAKPAITASEALSCAAVHLEVPMVVGAEAMAGPSGPQQVTPLTADHLSLEPIQAELMWLPIGRKVKLVWRFQIHTTDEQHVYDFTVDAEAGGSPVQEERVFTRFDWVTQDSYNVYPLPAESPNHTSGRALVVDPEETQLASPNGWHDTGSTSFSGLRGNNVHAYHDQDNNNVPPGVEPTCNSEVGNLVCDFDLNLSQDPSNFTDAAVANLFYWNNTIHDIQYLYGFDEQAGNFQVNNFGRGGQGGDDVRAEAQDGGGINNANFLTPGDGGRPRMQMYLWNQSNPRRDGDLDNGIVVHEYGHGISIRQVGGPSNVGCLGNAQQPGEGWSDWFALVYTAQQGDQGTDPRGIGTYALGQPTTGRGIRTQRYSTDPSVNTHTYSNINGMSIPHGVGEVWAQGLWEVYWALVDKHGFDPNLYNTVAAAGNHRALLYVNEGLKNTACSPTFTEARDGIIQAAIDNFGGEDVCTIWSAFANFGLGVDAVSGGSNSTNPTNGFSLPASCIPPPPAPVCDVGSIDFNTFGLEPYSNQDVTGSVTVENNGDTLLMEGNRWQRSSQTFTVTSGTKLEFQYLSTGQGEIHGIGFDEDQTLTNDLRLFQFWGTQNWTGAIPFIPRYSGSGSFESFTIPIGQSYTGTDMRLVFVNDKDAGALNNNGRFACVRVVGPGTVAAPDVVGLDETSANVAILGAGLIVGTVTRENSDTVSAGNVIRQNPVATTQVPPEGAVNYVLSLGPATVVVPDVVGLDETSANAAILGAELIVGTVTRENSDTVSAGNVIRQNPVATTQVPPDSAVNYVVSLGPATVTVPNVVGLAETPANTAIVGAGLIVGTVARANSDTVPAGNVISQNPVADLVVPSGMAVNLVVSLGSTSADIVDWNSTTTVAYSNQDSAGTVTIEDSGSTLFMTGNRWRRSEETFTITPFTVIEVEFQSDSQGEIHGIGFDEDDALTNNLRVFRLYGTQNWGGDIDWTTSYTGSGNFETFTIPVGQFYTGTGFRLVVVNDKDAGTPNNTSRFRNVRIFDNLPAPDTLPLVANFDSGTEGFTYVDNAFRNTNQPVYAVGSFLPTGGNTGGGLSVDLGGLDGADILNMSGGWQRTFQLSVPTEVVITLNFNLTQASDYESDEFSQALFSLDGQLFGLSPNDYLAQIVGNGNGGNSESTGWQPFQVNVGILPAGNHTIIIGGFNNKKTFANESTTILIDDVLVDIAP